MHHQLLHRTLLAIILMLTPHLSKAMMEPSDEVDTSKSQQQPKKLKNTDDEEGSGSESSTGTMEDIILTPPLKRKNTAYQSSNPESPIQRLYLCGQGMRDEQEPYTDALNGFYETCYSQLTPYFGSPDYDPNKANCDLEAGVATPFLDACRKLTKGLEKADTIQVIRVLSQLTLKHLDSGDLTSYLNAVISNKTTIEGRLHLIGLMGNLEDPTPQQLLVLYNKLDLGSLDEKQELTVLTALATVPFVTHTLFMQKYQSSMRFKPFMRTDSKIDKIKELTLKSFRKK